MSGCQLLKLQLGKEIGNGNTTRIWTDSWISPTNRTVPFGPPTESTQDLFVSDLLTRGTGEWNHFLVESIFPDLAQQIYLIRPSLFSVEDSHCWHKTGIYSVKSGYYALREASARQQELHPQITAFNWQKYVWREETSPKLKLFLWKLARGALPLGTNLQTRGISTNGFCPHCSNRKQRYTCFSTARSHDRSGTWLLYALHWNSLPPPHYPKPSHSCPL